ncbi:MAG: glutamate 5-kinase [Woeseiaceae bacterium]
MMSGFELGSHRRLVIKVGSALLVKDDGQVSRTWLQSLADDIAQLQSAGHELLIVSSGAIAIGSAALRLDKRRAGLADLQASAAAGQARLVDAYQKSLGRHDVMAAQVLLTPGDTEDRRRFLNARATLNRLVDLGVVPIINENDTVATEEIRYGDNDRLAARVSQLVMADALILLSDVDGLYDADPTQSTAATHIPQVEKITEDIVSIAGETRSDVGSGGMATKVQAARIATFAGCSTVITHGGIERPLSALAAQCRHTVFVAQGTPAAARKQWFAGALEVCGELRVDDGAATALQNGKSLLPVGVTSINGEFQRGDVVSLVNSAGVEIGRGLAEYSSQEAKSLLGQRSEHIEALLGYRGRSVIVHRDELVLFNHEH